MNKFCSRCGKPLVAADKFCQHCGQSVGAAVPAGSSVDETLRRITAAALAAARPAIAADPTNKSFETYFKPTDRYADSYLRFHRMGSLFRKADITTPISSIEIEIVIRPGILGDRWLAYGLDIATPQTAPTLELFTDWSEGSDGGDLPHDKLPPLEPYFLELLQGTLLPEGESPPRESPETMF